MRGISKPKKKGIFDVLLYSAAGGNEYVAKLESKIFQTGFCSDRVIRVSILHPCYAVPVDNKI